MIREGLYPQPIDIDLKNKTIKHINDKTFIEDSLRVYRAVQFASRFDFKIDEIADYISNNFKCFTSWTHLHKEIQKLEEQTSL